ncbi:DUF4863 family protein [Caldimonas tepidiphila]|uniref:4-hydroxylaminobenzoate lyase n=1 Tax=Caldimonas tepidiphila TaxID=2315841 RepID=UPI000E5B096D|nr:DUF4863 family protein [Caldimonas tepidiphila]
MSEQQFQSLVRTITQALQGRPVDAALEDWLNASYGPASHWFRDMKAACEAGVREGWMCRHEAGGIRWGRVVKPSAETAQFSVDVVDMQDCIGPHHSHPNGELDLVMPLTPDARFDGTPAGWKVYPPGSAHRPTVTTGRALVLYLLPEGSIQFTKAGA